ncbi:MAG: hypothetical protein IJI05_01050 [Erysipelotrichaceae bacterium]|nr:hypothetical protein [Erysipelotrichaceae bacterium]
MDNLVKISEIFGYVLPIIGAVALIVLIIVLLTLRKTLKNVNITVSKANVTVDGVNEAVGTTTGYLKELKPTVMAVNNMAMSVEAVRATTERVVKRSVKKISKQYNQVKTMVSDMLEKGEQKSVSRVEEVVADLKPTFEGVMEKATEVIDEIKEVV